MRLRVEANFRDDLLVIKLLLLELFLQDSLGNFECPHFALDFAFLLLRRVADEDLFLQLAFKFLYKTRLALLLAKR